MPCDIEGRIAWKSLGSEPFFDLSATPEGKAAVKKYGRHAWLYDGRLQ